MIEKLVLIKSNSDTLKKTKNIKLSIQFSLDGFSFCTSNIDSEQIILFKRYSFEESVNTPEKLLSEIETIFKTNTNLQSDFIKVEVIHQNNLSTIVPNSYFDENSLNNYLKYTIKTLKNDFITFDDIEDIGAKNVYIPYVNINNYLFQNFGEFDYKHHSSILIQKLLASNTINEKVIYVDVAKNTLDIVVLKGKELILFNSFSYYSKEDFIYYLLFVAEQHLMDTKDFQLYFLGSISDKSELYEITHSYIKNVDFLKSNKSIYKDLNLPNHSNYILLG